MSSRSLRTLHRRQPAHLHRVSVRCFAIESPPAPPKRSTQPVLAIRRETINAWERRAPLAPTHVRMLVDQGVKVLVQPSNRRAYPIQDYMSAGAIPRDDLSEADVIMSVKTVPIDELIPNKTYAFFSHTIKAQKENMPLLDSMLEKNITLIDYEKMVDDDQSRLVMFGKWAGYAGLIDIIHGLGLRLLALGHHTPFLHIGLAHNYRDSHMAVNALRDCGYSISLGLMPHSLGPLIFTFTGRGNVSQGAQELIRHLPHEYVDAQTLPQVAARGNRNRIYICQVNKEDHLVRKDGGKFDAKDWAANPDQYKSVFSEKIAAYSSVIVNGIYWAPGHPRLVTIPDIKKLLSPTAKMSPDMPGEPTLPHRLVAMCDISADPGGSMEFMTECTTIDKPFCIYDADQNKDQSDTFATPSGVLVCSIDNMPAQMPTEATKHFGHLLLPFVRDILRVSPSDSWENVSTSDVVKRAIITHNKKLTPQFEYLKEMRSAQHTSSHKTGNVYGAGHDKKVLMLGAGMVSGPIADYFGQQKNVNVTAVSAIATDLEKLAKLGDHVTPVVCDVQQDRRELEKMIGESDIVMSMLPYTMHPYIAKICLEQNTNLVTSSYISPAMQELDEEFQRVGLTCMNEVGLDPGIDHLLAMQCIDAAHEAGHKVVEFVSYCGGLPAPECSDNALRYKFSWSPRGVLLALQNHSRYLDNGVVVEVPDCLDFVKPVDFMPGFKLVGYPNRDSTVYGREYGIPECKTLLRGTLRYEGFVEAVKGLKHLGLLSQEQHPELQADMGPEWSWKEFVAKQLNRRTDIFPDSLRKLAAETMPNGSDSQQFKALESLGLFSEDTPMERCGTPMDSLVAHLGKTLAYKPGERDIVILHHTIVTEKPDGSQRRHDIDLVCYGDPNGHSAMAATVGYTAAIAANMVLTGEIQRKGMQRPLHKDVYITMLNRLAQLGIRHTERVRGIDPMTKQMRDL